jgi:hypothetical protein
LTVASPSKSSAAISPLLSRARASHARAGIAAWYCPYTGSERLGDACAAVATVDHGDITLAGHGTAEIKQLSETKTAMTIRLR